MCGSRPDADAVTASAGTSDSSTPLNSAISRFRSMMEAMSVSFSGPKLVPDDDRPS